MKKNKSMRIASFLLVATLLTTSIISGTFAKYTTMADASDTARVAKWGVVASVSDNFFGEKYVIGNKGDGTENTITTSTNANDFSVATSAAGTNVVAPGTKNEDFSYAVTGIPEVDGVIKIAVTGNNIFLSQGEYVKAVKVENPVASDLSNYIVYSNNNYRDPSGAFDPSETYYTMEPYCTLSTSYYPVVFKLSGSGAPATSCNANSLAAIAAHLQQNKTFKAGQNLSSALTLPQISWEWKFCNNTTACSGYDVSVNSNVTTLTNACDYCKADTLLGDLIAARVDNVENESSAIIEISNGACNRDVTGFYYPTSSQRASLDLKFDMKCVVTQID